MKWFRVRTDDGRIVGVCEMSEDDAIRNLPRGQLLVPHDPAVSLQSVWKDGGWVDDGAPPIGPESDHRFMRRSGYDVGAQVGALMKIAEALVSDATIAALLPHDVKAEFDALVAHNAAIKTAYPVKQD